jgi:hypothetical protein
VPYALRAQTPYVMENLGRGVVAVRATERTVYIGWRLLGTDERGVQFSSTSTERPAEAHRLVSIVRRSQRRRITSMRRRT